VTIKTNSRKPDRAAGQITGLKSQILNFEMKQIKYCLVFRHGGITSGMGFNQPYIID